MTHSDTFMAATRERDDDLAALRRDADAGDVRAMTRLGARPLISATAANVTEGVDLLFRGIELDDPEAMTLLATTTAAGAIASPDWPGALDLIERARGRMRPALMYDGATKTANVDPHRTCSDYQFDILNTDLVLLLVRERIAALTKLPPAAMEPPRIFHYALGEEIKAHYDRCGDQVGGYGREGGYRGDRIVTFLLYLNDDFDGGELTFPKTGFKVKGAKGDAVYFAHIDGEGKPDPMSLHAGLTVTREEKWVLSQWIHDRPFGVAERR
jgi:hypothetical protein